MSKLAKKEDNSMSLFYRFCNSYFLVGLVIFLFTIIISILVRYVFLPTFLPSSISSQGLLNSTDSIGYHQLALDMAAQIELLGWSAWELRPKGHFISGLFSALYVCIVPNSWISIPFSAIVHAISVVLIMRLARSFTDDSRWALIASLPYALFPSAAFWYTQLLKDGYFNLGVFAFMLGWVLVFRSDQIDRSTMRLAISPIVLVVLGYLIQGMVRPYVMAIVLLVSMILFSIAAATAVLRYYRGQSSAKIAVRMALVAACCVIVPWILKTEIGYRYWSASSVEMDRHVTLEWQETKWVPQWLEARLHALSDVRVTYIRVRPDAASAIDRDVIFNDAIDVIAYIPRAIQIAFLAPFPNQWFVDGSTAATTIMRRISMVEMLVIYALIPFVLVAAFRLRRYGHYWVTFAYPVVVMLIYALATPNIGTLYRVRFGYLTIIIAVAIVTFGEIVSARKKKQYRTLP